MRKFLVHLFAAAALLASAGGATADEGCTNLKGLWLDLTPSDDGYLVPMSVEGEQHLFLLEIGTAHAILDQRIVDTLKLPTKDIPRGMTIKLHGDPVKRIATAPTIQLGPVTRREAEFLVSPHRISWGQKGEGVIGMNVLYGFDIDLDLAHNKLGLFLPRECPFTPYWKHDVMGTAPFEVRPMGFFLLPMALDGTKIQAYIATSDKRTYMPLTTAHMLFDIEDKSPGVVAAGKRDSGEDIFRYPFKLLSADNVTINNPEIYIYRNKEKLCDGVSGDWYNRANPNSTCFGGGDLELGLNVLRKLRLFFAFKEKKVYFTPAEPLPDKPVP
jgi:hypothetical protein